MAAPAVAPTGAAQVAEPMIIIEPEKNEATTTSMTPKLMLLRSVGHLPNCNPQL